MMTLSNQLNLRLRHPDYQNFLDFNEDESKRVRNQYNCYLDQKYGMSALQGLDIFPSKISNSPILIFIHGGYWRALDKRSYSFIAEPFVKNNFTVCVINYRLIPMVNMEDVLDDIRDAISLIQREAIRYNGNPQAITLSGHSAGGHLALMAYLMDENIRSSIQAICSLSGIFDLEPIKNSFLNEELHLSNNDVKSYSPIRKDLSIVNCPTLLSVGSGETDFFIEQSKSLFNKNQSLNFLHYYEYEKLNHYQIVHKLGQENNPLTQFILENGKNK
ncbi:alpha/beta hydrolase [Xanthovirga aplysinae]|uniref:alpha/beta hydrolase n=1 Tax=Xanthovirga aplysinae TaxID=2529853 RepID=UPI0012BBC91C|nr:alpha/beta hydrolase [Xanthovirga aplysinae]MTI33101.1 alpha/beta hydrolase [Xanthovirga aplysinae]